MMDKFQFAFYFDQSRCMSCNACTVACKDWNMLNPGQVNYRKQFTYEKDGAFFPLSLGCNHCEDPACMKVCSYNAISKSDDGIVTVDRAKCRELRVCISACPFAKPMIADDKQEPNPIVGWKVKHPMQKCTMCRDRLDDGERPACILSCVGRALDFGTVESIISKYPDAVRLNPNDFPYAYVNNTNDTKPAIFIKPKKRNSLTIHKSAIYKG